VDGKGRGGVGGGGGGERSVLRGNGGGSLEDIDTL